MSLARSQRDVTAGEPLVDADGFSPTLYHALWRKNAQGQSCPGVNVPETVVFKYQKPVQWLFTSAVDRQLKRKHIRNVTNGNILEAFSKRRKSATLDICASHMIHLAFENHGQDDQSMAADTTSVEFFDARGVRNFVGRREKASQGLLQRFVEPKGDHNFLIRATWSPQVCLMERRINRHRIDDTKVDANSRLSTYEGGEHMSESSPVVGSLLAGRVQALCQAVAQHVADTSGQQIARMVLNFKVDPHDTIWFLYCSSLRVLQWWGGPCGSLNLGPHFVLRPCQELQERKYGPPVERHDTFVCTLTGKTCPTAEQCEVSFKTVMLHWSLQGPPDEGAGDSFALPPIPEAIARTVPGLTRVRYQQLRNDPTFLYRTTYVCQEACIMLNNLAIDQLEKENPGLHKRPAKPHRQGVGAPCSPGSVSARTSKSCRRPTSAISAGGHVDRQGRPQLRLGGAAGILETNTAGREQRSRPRSAFVDSAREEVPSRSVKLKDWVNQGHASVPDAMPNLSDMASTAAGAPHAAGRDSNGTIQEQSSASLRASTTASHTAAADVRGGVCIAVTSTKASDVTAMPTTQSPRMSSAAAGARTADLATAITHADSVDSTVASGAFSASSPSGSTSSTAMHPAAVKCVLTNQSSNGMHPDAASAGLDASCATPADSAAARQPAAADSSAGALPEEPQPAARTVKQASQASATSDLYVDPMALHAEALAKKISSVRISSEELALLAGSSQVLRQSLLLRQMQQELAATPAADPSAEKITEELLAQTAELLAESAGGAQPPLPQPAGSATSTAEEHSSQHGPERASMPAAGCRSASIGSSSSSQPLVGTTSATAEPRSEDEQQPSSTPNAGLPAAVTGDNSPPRRRHPAPETGYSAQQAEVQQSSQHAGSDLSYVAQGSLPMPQPTAHASGPRQTRPSQHTQQQHLELQMPGSSLPDDQGDAFCSQDQQQQHKNERAPSVGQAGASKALPASRPGPRPGSSPGGMSALRRKQLALVYGDMPTTNGRKPARRPSAANLAQARADAAHIQPQSRAGVKIIEDMGLDAGPVQGHKGDARMVPRAQSAPVRKPSIEAAGATCISASGSQTARRPSVPLLPPSKAGSEQIKRPTQSRLAWQ